MTKPADRFETIDLLGQSDHSVVIRGRDFQSNLEVAVKMARDGATIHKRFSREVEAMQSAAGPNVMPVLEVDVDGEWYTMPIAKQELTKATGGLSSEKREQLAYGVVEVVADGLRAFHKNGQVHRDLKPQNVLWLDDEGDSRWVVSDFGIARNTPGSTTSQLTKVGGLLGTKGWAAPELHHDAHNVAAPTDVYSLGAIVSWILTNEFPTDAAVPRPTGRFRSVVVRATRREPARRFPTIDLMLTAMENELAGPGGPLSSELSALLAPPVNYGELSLFWVTHSNNPELLLLELPSLSSADRVAWFLADPEGLLEVAVQMCAMLQDEQGRAGLNKDGLNPPLLWIFGALRLFLNRNELDMAEPLAVGFFEALEVCDQWKVSREVGPWLKGLGDRDAQGMIVALEAADAGDYVRNWMENDEGTPKSAVLRRWIT